MIHFVFDLDDTLIYHKNEVNYDYIYENKELTYYLESLMYPKHILTNGTREHASIVLQKMKLKSNFTSIHAREDTHPYPKPYPSCYKHIVRDIIYDKSSTNIILFFDDLLINLEEAHNQNWITIWIHPNSHLSSKYDFVDYAFPDIITALIHFNKKAKKRII